MSFQFTVFQKSFLFLIIFIIGARTQVKCAILVHF